MLNKPLNDALQTCSALVDKKMNILLPQDFIDSNIVAAMRYSALSEGKRLRPFLVMASAEIFGVKSEFSLNAAAAIEFIHSYSLIHDDLPAMDDDDFRRDQPSCHKKFDEATAILAGDALLTLAFEILSSEETHKDASVRIELIKILAKSAGFRGMVGGQMIDLESLQKKLTKEQIANMHRQKTGELFMAAAEMGAVLGHASHKNRMSLRYFANDLGLAFQIRDDILDANEQSQTSIVDSIGLEAAHQQLDLLRDQSIAHLEIFGEKAEILRELARFVTKR